jgi:hypothetical protein
MEPESSIPRSQDPSTGPYPEPYHSNPLHPILSRYLKAMSDKYNVGLYRILYLSNAFFGK